MPILFICSEIILQKTGGGHVSRRNYEIVSSIFGQDNIIKFTIFLEKSKIRRLLNNILGYKGGLNSRKVKDVLSTIQQQKIKHVFIDSSIFGTLAKRIKEKNSSVEVFCHFHNIEYNIWSDFLSTTKVSLLKKLLLIPIYQNEYNALSYADKLILLNQRELRQLKRVYGEFDSTKVTIIPITFNDQYTDQIVKKEMTGVSLLFVGSFFFANYEGIKWFIKNVMSNIENIKLIIVGKGFDEKRSELERSNVRVVGTVDSLEPYYENAQIVVSPIFSGAGMKTKTAEALMFGKYILGTSEAFEGYDLDFEKVGGICNTANDFLLKIKELQKCESLGFNEYSRLIFKKQYSNTSARLAFKALFNK